MHFCFHILNAYLNDNHRINACIFRTFLEHIIPGPTYIDNRHLLCNVRICYYLRRPTNRQGK
jgi:hypothetical protein